LPLRKYSVLPSGENAGEFTFQPSGLIWCGGTLSRVTRLRSHSDVLALLVVRSITRLENTSTRPSGESVGEP